MFVVCPKCGSKYQIPSEITLKKGQKLQCSTCKATFPLTDSIVVENLQKRELKVPLNPVLKETTVVIRKEEKVETPYIPEEFHPLKPMSEKKNLSIVLWILISLLALVIGVLFAWSMRDNTIDSSLLNYPPKITKKVVTQPITIEKPVVEKEPAIMGEPIPLFPDEIDEEQFSFDKVHFRQLNEGEQKTVLIEGVIRNDSDIERELPERIYANAYDMQGQILFKKEIYLPKENLLPHLEKEFFSTYQPVVKDIQWIDISFD